MARYTDIADDLRARLALGEWEPGTRLPSINELQDHYDVPGLNTIRAAQRILIDEGLLRAEQGVGVFAIRAPGRGVDLRGELEYIRGAAARALTLTDAAGSSRGGDHATFTGLNANNRQGRSVLALALDNFAEHCRDKAQAAEDARDDGEREMRAAWATEAERLLTQLETWT